MGALSFQSAPLAASSLKYCRQAGQYLRENLLRHTFKPFATSRCEVESAGLIASHNARGRGPRAREGHSKPRYTREVPAAGNWQHHRHLCKAIERLRRDDNHRPPTLLFVAFGRIEADQPDFASFHLLTLEQLSANRKIVQPFAVFASGPRRLCVTLSQQLA
jgi:hypothetical protein